MHPKIAEYVQKNIYDPDRISTEECKKKNLPYMQDGKFYNMNAFKKASNTFNETGAYCSEAQKTETYKEFWLEERRRIREGLWLGQLRVDGYYYFFLNYYRMKIASEDGEEIEGFAYFRDYQFWFSHLFAYSWSVKKNFSLIKPRSVGLTEYAASCTTKDVLIPSIVKGQLQYRSHLCMAASDDYLNGDDQLFSKASFAINWCRMNTNEGIYQNLAVNQVEGMWIKAGVKHVDGSIKPTGGEVSGRAINKPDKARGGRKTMLWLEESGANQYLGKTIQTAESLTRRQEHKTGIAVIWGTSNEDSKGIAQFTKVLKSPVVYNCLRFRNVWKNAEQDKSIVSKIPRNPFEYLIQDDEMPNKNEVGYFIPYFTVRKFDPEGNADWQTAYNSIMKERANKLAGAGDDNGDVLLYIADHPVSMEEALMVVQGKRFKSPDLARQLVKIKEGMIKVKVFRGNFYPYTVDGKMLGVEFMPDPNGNSVFLEHPEWATCVNETKQIWRVEFTSNKIKNLYVAGVDTVDIAEGERTSSGGSSTAMLIKKRRPEKNAMSSDYINTYVGAFLGNSERARIDHQQVLYMAIYFNSKMLVEFTKITIVSYIRDIMKMGSYLAYEPDAPSRSIVTYKAKSNRPGLRASTEVIKFYLNLIDEYLDENSGKIYFVHLLEQLINYSWEEKGNYDLVAAMGMCEVLFTEYLDIKPMEQNSRQNTIRPMSWYTDSTGKKVFGVRPREYQSIR